MSVTVVCMTQWTTAAETVILVIEGDIGDGDMLCCSGSTESAACRQVRPLSQHG